MLQTCFITEESSLPLADLSTVARLPLGPATSEEAIVDFLALRRTDMDYRSGRCGFICADIEETRSSVVESERRVTAGSVVMGPGLFLVTGCKDMSKHADGGQYTGRDLLVGPGAL